MTDPSLASSARMMRAVGWFTLLAVPAGLVLYPPGFLWSTHPESPHHPPLSPYLFVLLLHAAGHVRGLGGAAAARRARWATA